MNNQQFRDLFTSDSAAKGTASASAHSNLGGKRTFASKPSRGGSTVPSDSAADYAQKFRAHHALLQPNKKLKSSAPKGAKLAAGYVDRAKERAEAERREEEERARRIRALEQQVKLGTLSQADFDSLKEKITADQGPRVKGLDRALLERARRGEDVLASEENQSEEAQVEVDVDDELDKLGSREIAPVQQERKEKTGIKAAAQVAGVKRTRDEIMAELKAKRQAAAQEKAKDTPVFDHRWRKVGEQAKPRIEIDHKGREVLITVDEDGIVKRMVRKTPAGGDAAAAVKVDQSRPVLGADFALPDRKPEPAEKEESDDDEDIFAGAGTHYDPLGEEEEDSDEEEEGDPASRADSIATRPQAESPLDPEQTKPSGVNTVAPRRNYFNDTTTSSADTTQTPDYQDVQNIIKRAAQIGAAQESAAAAASEEQANGKLAKLQSTDRDLDDLDIGFGSSRFEDDDEGPARLSRWKKRDGDEAWDDEDDARGDGKRKRKPKKRKGDGNNVDDVMRVLEGRRAAASASKK